MSSARSNAAARSRRAGEGPGMPQQQQQQPNGRPGQQVQQGQQGQQANNLKLSVSDAIALITLRLGRVEQLVQNMPVDGQTSLANNLDENVRIVDNTVFENMVQRLDSLEKNQRILAERKPTVIAQQPTNTVVAPVSAVVTESIDVLKAEMVQVKELLLHLQSFTMQTNQRLSDIVFTGNEFLENDECDNDIISGNIIDETSAHKLLNFGQPVENDLVVTNVEEEVSN
jgi:hypothetical protein